MAWLRRLARRSSPDGDEPDGRAMFLLVGLGNPGERYARTRHNVGFLALQELERRWDLPKPRSKFRGLIAEGRTTPGGPRVATLAPQTFMNESGLSVGPARGSLHVELDHLIVIHDEIDLTFGEIRSKFGGGLAGNNGLKSLKRELGSAEFWRVRAGIGRPDSTDPELVSAHVLGRFSESDADVRALVEGAADEAERLIERIESDDARTDDV